MRVLVLSFLLTVGMIRAGVAQVGGGSAAEHQQKAHQLLNEKKPQLAAKEFAAVLEVDPNNLDAQANLGVLLYFQKDYAEAEPHLRAAVEQQSNLTKNSKALLGLCERRLGKTDAGASNGP